MYDPKTWKATQDLVVPRGDEEHLGTFVAEGDVVPEELREAVEAMAKPKSRRKR